MNRMPSFRRSIVVMQPRLFALLLGSTSIAGCGEQKDPIEDLNNPGDESSEPTTPTGSASGEVTDSSMSSNPNSSPGGTSAGTSDDSDVDTSGEPTGGDTSEPPDSSEPATSEPPSGDELCPMKAGATWTYFHSGGGGWSETLTTSEADYEGEPALLVADTPNPNDDLRTDSYHVKEGGRLLRLYKEQYWVNPANSQETLDSSATYGVGFLRCDNAWLSKEIGFSESPGYLRVETVAGQSPKPGEERKHTFTIEGREDITTSSGLAFTDCVKVRRGKDWAATTGEDVEEKLYWFCPGVGKVREENVTSGNYEELTEYDIPE